MLTSEHWSFIYEHWLDSACVDAQRARLHGVVYKYRLILLHCGDSLFCTVEGAHNFSNSFCSCSTFMLWCKQIMSYTKIKRILFWACKRCMPLSHAYFSLQELLHQCEAGQ
jgi:hypothetical protein